MPRALYRATVVAVRHNPVLQPHDERLSVSGKREKVALVAAMRQRPAMLNAIAGP